MQRNNEFYTESTLIDEDKSLIEALKEKDMLKGERSTLSKVIMALSIFLSGFINAWRLWSRSVLVKQGEIGLSLDNGKAVFLEPGWHTFNSPFHRFIDVVSINDNVIECGDTTIVTVPRGKVGICKNYHQYRFMQPGRHILKAPQQFIRNEDINQEHICEGSLHRFRVEQSQVAVYYDQKGNTKILQADAPYYFDDPDIRGHEILSTSIITKKIQPLEVTTQCSCQFHLEAVVQYQIVDPTKLVNNLQDNQKRNASGQQLEHKNDKSYESAFFSMIESTLTHTFRQHTLDEITPQKPQLTRTDEFGDTVQIPPSTNPQFVATLSNDFMIHLASVAKNDWGIEIKSIQFTRIEPGKDLKDVFKARAKSRVETVTNQQNVDAKNDTEMSTTQREADQLALSSRANLEAARLKADGKVYKLQQLVGMVKQELGPEAAKQFALRFADKAMLSGSKVTLFAQTPNNLALYNNKPLIGLSKEQS